MSTIPSAGIVPYGGILRKLYENAQRRDIEYTSSAFWQAFLQSHFYPASNYAVVCEYAPGDHSRSRIDITVLRYRDTEHEVIRLILVEAKRPGGSPKDVETQALRGCRTVMENENLMGLYAITTIGTTYRTWSASQWRKGLSPLHGEAPLGTKDGYIDADTAEAQSLLADIEYIKTEPTPLRVAPTVPSQANLLPPGVLLPSMPGYATTSQQPAMPTFTYTQTADYEQPATDYEEMEPNSPGEGMDLDEAAGPSTSGKQAAYPVSDQTMGEQPSSQMEGQGSIGEGQGSVGGSNFNWTKVTLQRKTHFSREAEFIFTNGKGHRVSTSRDQWRKTRYEGERVYVYDGKHHVYYSTERPM
ncbi:hypothetical protein F4825DRAFT_475944 [Nemania diffusa]|nr:hypothetical protein F4825DRAFT_475944 [Nemania diffusa]